MTMTTNSTPANWTGVADVVTITPQLAEELLTRNTNNRPLRRGLAEKYAAAIRRGEWRVNGETIKIARDGRILDGQHRLWAVIEAGLPIESYIVYGLDPSAFTTIDTGARRAASDVMAIRGEVSTRTLAAAATVVYRHERDLWTTYYGRLAPSHDELLAIVEGEPALRDAVTTANRIARQCHIPPGLLAGLITVLGRIDGGAADAFFDGLSTGANLSEGSPMLALRRWLINNMSSQHRYDQPQIAARVFKAWNAWRRNQTMAAVRWVSSGKYAEPFPRPF